MKLPTGRPLSAVVATVLFCATAIAAEDSEEHDLPLTGSTEKLSFRVDEGSWMSLDITPDGETIVFDLLGDLYRLPLAGGEATRITAGLGFDSQPAISPDGDRLAFVSDRSGSDNLWVSRIDGSGARKISDEKHFGLISPAWTPDGRFLIATRTADKPELTMYHVDGGKGVTLSGPDEETKVWGVGADLSPDGRYVYVAAETDSNGPVENFPKAQIHRYDLDSGHLDQVTRGEGGGLRPLLSPDGGKLVYGTRDDARTGLRIRDLVTGEDEWLVWPVQRDAQENWRPPSRDTLPGHAFTPDGRYVVFNADGGFHKVDVATGERQAIPFEAAIELDVGPDLTAGFRVPQGPLEATLIHDPAPSPDGEAVVASVLASLYVTPRDGGRPRRLTDEDALEFKPAWSPDGRWIAYVTWTTNDGGHVWRTRANGRGRPERLTEHPAFYTDLVYSPDGETLIAMRGNAFMRHQTFSEFTGLGIPLELVSLPAEGGPVTPLLPAREARYPHFGADPARIYLYADELYSVATDGSDRRVELKVTGPKGNRRSEDPPAAQLVRLSPTGRHVLALVNEQVWVMPFTRTGGKAATVAVEGPALPAVRITGVGADFAGWSVDGDEVHWAIGNRWYSRPLASIDFREADDDEDDEGEGDEGDVDEEDPFVERARQDENDSDSGTSDDDGADGDDDENDDEPFVARDEHEAVEALDIVVEAARNTPRGRILLTNANLIPMRAETTDGMREVLERHDILVTDNRIDTIAPSGDIEVDAGTRIVDLGGRWVLPGLIDTHAHWEFRTGDVLEPHNWSLVANLAYGVTTGLDVQTAYKDYFAYRDFQQIGRSIGQRAFMVGRGVFGNQDFDSYDATHAYLRRYTEHYHTNNIKAYVSGNRKQRQWIVKAAKELELMPTTEGAGDQKLDLTHAIDGMHGNEHNLPDLPIFDDVAELFARTRTAYTPTLIVQYNAANMREFFFTRESPGDNAKLARFYPANRLDELTERRPEWREDAEFAFREGAEVAAKIQRAGGLVGVGGHAELQGLGYHWELWAYAMGGMAPVEVLRAATIDGARIIGVAEDLGSLEAGKLADLVVLDANPLEDIRHTTSIRYVMQDGRLYDGDTLDELWPAERPLPPFWWWREDDRRYSPNAGAAGTTEGSTESR